MTGKQEPFKEGLPCESVRVLNSLLLPACCIVRSSKTEDGKSCARGFEGGFSSLSDLAYMASIGVKSL